MPERLRVLIVDDEPLARQRIEDLLAKKDSIDIVGTASNGSEAVELIRRLSPNLVFLDVQMPGMSGLDVVDTIGPQQMPATIFTTAYDKFALKAFDRAAVDYLMKPFDDERFSQALRRARKTIELKDDDLVLGEVHIFEDEIPRAHPRRDARTGARRAG